MQVKEISVECKRTFNLQNYESVTLSVRYSAEITEDEDFESCTQELYTQCKKAIKANVPPNYRAVVQSSEKVAGLEVES